MKHEIQCWATDTGSRVPCLRFGKGGWLARDRDDGKERCACIQDTGTIVNASNVFAHAQGHSTAQRVRARDYSAPARKDDGARTKCHSHGLGRSLRAEAASVHPRLRRARGQRPLLLLRPHSELRVGAEANMSGAPSRGAGGRCRGSCERRPSIGPHFTDWQRSRGSPARNSSGILIGFVQFPTVRRTISSYTTCCCSPQTYAVAYGSIKNVRVQIRYTMD